MTVDDVKKRVSEIADIRGDDEKAHVKEDALHQDVLRAIADHLCEDPDKCAQEALKSLDIDFARWYA